MCGIRKSQALKPSPVGDQLFPDNPLRPAREANQPYPWMPWARW
jgi:hypothetical protein